MMNGWFRSGSASGYPADPPPPLRAFQLPVNELPHRPRQLLTLRPGALNQLTRDLRGHVARALRGAEHELHRRAAVHPKQRRLGGKPSYPAAHEMNARYCGTS